MKKMKRVLAGLLGVMMAFSIIMSGKAVTQVNAADTITVDFSDGKSVENNVITYAVGDVDVTVEVNGASVSDSKVVVPRDQEDGVTFTLGNTFNPDTMEVQIYSESGFNTTLAVTNNQTSLVAKQNEGGLPDAVKLKVVEKQNGGDNPPHVITDPEEIAVNITGDTDKLEPVKVDGSAVSAGKVTVQKAETHTIAIQYQFGYKFNQIKINGTIMPLDSVDQYGTVVYTGMTPEEGAYNIDVQIGDGAEKTLAWEYGESSSLGSDAVVSHGKIEIAGGDGISDLTEDEDKGGLFSITPGTTVTVKLIPDQGYQLKQTSLNGGENVSVDVTAATEVSTFTFVMPNTNLRLGVEFERGEDVVETDSVNVENGELSNVDGAIDSGNLELSIGDMNPSDEQKKEIEAAAGDGEVHLYLDMEMNQVLNKGSENEVWKTKLTELKKTVTITLKLTDTILVEQAKAGQLYVIRDHDGTLEKLPVVYNEADGTISFETDQFSPYALASGGTTGQIVIGGEEVSYQKGMKSYWKYDKATSVTTPCLEEEANIILDDTYDDSQTTYDRLDVTLKNVEIVSKDEGIYDVSGYGLRYDSVLYLNIYGDCKVTGSEAGLYTTGTMRIYGKDATAKLTAIGDSELNGSNGKGIGVHGYDKIHIYNQFYTDEGSDFSFVTRSNTYETIENVGCTLHGDNYSVITSENFDGSDSTEHFWDGESFNIGDTDQYQYIEYKVNRAGVEFIDVINITDAALSFQPGEAPRFTGKVATSDQNKYAISLEFWFRYDENGDVIEDCWPSWNGNYGKLVTFQKDKTYYYSVVVTAGFGYKFAEDVRLIVNGEEINYKAGKYDLGSYMISAYDIIAMTPTEKTEPAKPVDPNAPTKGGSDDKSSESQTDKAENEVKAATETGDHTNMLLLFVMIAVSGTAIVGTTLYRRKMK